MQCVLAKKVLPGFMGFNFGIVAMADAFCVVHLTGKADFRVA